MFRVFLKSLPFLTGITTVSYLNYEILRPKNLAEYLIWKGYRLIKEEKIWKAVYEEYSDKFENSKELKS